MTNVVGAATLAACFKLTERQVRRLAEDGVVVRASRGRYKLAESVQGFIAHALAGQSSAYESADLTEARRQLLVEQARRERRNNDVQEQRLVPRAEHETVLQAGMAAMVQSLEALPGRCAAELVAMDHAATIRHFLLDEVRRCRSTMSEAMSALAELPLPEIPEVCPLCQSKLREVA